MIQWWTWGLLLGHIEFVVSVQEDRCWSRDASRAQGVGKLMSVNSSRSRLGKTSSQKWHLLSRDLRGRTQQHVWRSRMLICSNYICGIINNISCSKLLQVRVTSVALSSSRPSGLLTKYSCAPDSKPLSAAISSSFFVCVCLLGIFFCFCLHL